MQPFVFLIVALVIIFDLIFTILIIRIIKKKRKKKLNISTSTINNLKNGTGNYEGIDYSYSYYGGSKNSPPSFFIILNCLSNFSFSIKKETGFDRFFKNIGITSEISTYDVFFDEKFYIDTNNPKIVETLFRKSTCRDVINRVYEKGFKNIRFSRNKLVISISPFRNKNLLTKQDIEDTIPILAKLVKEINQTQTDFGQEIDNIWKYKRILAFTIPIITEFFGFIMLMIGINKYKPLDSTSLVFSTVIYIISAIILYLLIATVLIKGRSSSHRELILIFFLTITGFSLSFIGGKFFLNGFLDKSNPKYYENLPIINTYSKSKKNGHNYYLVVNSWRDNEGKCETIKISYNAYSNIQINQSTITVITKSGRFNYEWITDFYIDN